VAHTLTGPPGQPHAIVVNPTESDTDGVGMLNARKPVVGQAAAR
jgi:hypothetical protein